MLGKSPKLWWINKERLNRRWVIRRDIPTEHTVIENVLGYAGRKENMDEINK
jgi:hypothetical protein